MSTENFLRAMDAFAERKKEQRKIAQGPKEQIFKRILKKRQKGYPISKNEVKFAKGYLGIDENKKTTADIKPKDRLKVRELAKEMAKNDYAQRYQKMMVNNVVGTQPHPDEYNVSEEMITQYLPRATKFLYPNMEIKSPKDVQQIKPERVKVKAPDGRVGMIPKENLKAAKQKGFEIVE